MNKGSDSSSKELNRWSRRAFLSFSSGNMAAVRVLEVVVVGEEHCTLFAVDFLLSADRPGRSSAAGYLQYLTAIDHNMARAACLVEHAR